MDSVTSGTNYRFLPYYHLYLCKEGTLQISVISLSSTWLYISEILIGSGTFVSLTTTESIYGLYYNFTERTLVIVQVQERHIILIIYFCRL